MSSESLAKLRARLDGVEYIFLDEVSMLSCHHMYQISLQLTKATGYSEKAFGGVNMIFAGDFAQLPPAGKGQQPLYSGTVGTQVYSGVKMWSQESAIGKALWHQITTVVILRDNMRQKTQSLADEKFRTALENMRYRSCTSEDISFLETRIAGAGFERPSLAENRFHNVAIITAWNSQKDRINELGCHRFARQTKQQLTEFYSIDKLSVPDLERKYAENSKPPNARAKHIYMSGTIFPSLQKELWDLPYASTGHYPGKLLLCIGLPIMIRYNIATELCITKGQEGTVVGWQYIKAVTGEQILDTLFVKLTNPPTTVKLDGLPESVVPIVKCKQITLCFLRDDTVIRINRDQVPVLPNFAMTDFASQGKTRPDNPVDLTNCRDHRSIYTCLSRSATAAGTLIIQGFDRGKLTGGTTGYLRQEFRELEILDEVTQLKYEGKIPLSVNINGHRRNTIIQQFRDWKGANYMPQKVHPAIGWSSTQPYEFTITNDSSWQTISKIKKNVSSIKYTDRNSNYVAAKGSTSVFKRPIDEV
jgi:hypothetical protein